MGSPHLPPSSPTYLPSWHPLPRPPHPSAISSFPLHFYHRRCSTRAPSPRKPPPPLLSASVASAVAPSSPAPVAGQRRLNRSLLPSVVAILPHASRRHLCRRLAPPQPLPSSFPLFLPQQPHALCAVFPSPPSSAVAFAAAPSPLLLPSASAASAAAPSPSASAASTATTFLPSSLSPSAIPAISHCSRCNPLPQPPSHSHLQPSVAHTHTVTTSSLLFPFFPAPHLSPLPPIVGRCLPFFPAAAASPLAPLLPRYRRLLAVTIASDRALIFFPPVVQGLKPARPAWKTDFKSSSVKLEKVNRRSPIKLNIVKVSSGVDPRSMTTGRTQDTHT
ncbi:hypothetical protein B296_00033955 [Ensete ventricosum]|uniref:Uncharacterized protein n=1 Tax=Ensete ventricosum TaxID=4639 RepID=A0A426YVR0_ENSVE|nr:hypothetical protein B296_00033955 [Ensete ventricosum]